MPWRQALTCRRYATLQAAISFARSSKRSICRRWSPTQRRLRRRSTWRWRPWPREPSPPLREGKELELLDRVEIPGAVSRIFADAQRGVVDEVVRRPRQFGGPRHAAIDATGRVIFGAVARTEIAADPVRHRRGLTGIRIEQRNAAEMGADTDQHAEFRLERAVPILRVGRLLHLLGIRVGQTRGVLLVLQHVERLLGAVIDPDRPLAPAHHDL